MKNNFFDQQMIMEIKQRYDPRRWTTTQVIAEQNPKKSNLRTQVHIFW